MGVLRSFFTLGGQSHTIPRLPWCHVTQRQVATAVGMFLLVIHGTVFVSMAAEVSGCADDSKRSPH